VLKVYSNISDPITWVVNHSSDINLSWDQKQIRDHFTNKNCLNIFFEDKNHILGLILGHIIFNHNQNREIEILHLGVLKNKRNNGIGYSLMNSFEKKAHLEGEKTTIFLEVNAQNEIAIKLYEKLGYKAYNERKNYYKNLSNINAVGDSAILFKKIINE
jgi:ribosomal protein S18 acetylase RimI-like enzyme|tara:strand:- start:30 stop:506 length:477 start_codon:yes stop_codon:yes gene_type:complete